VDEHELRGYTPVQPRGTDWRGLWAKIWGPVIAIGATVIKLGFTFAKFFAIFIAVGGYALIWGWRFAIGIVLLILVHELGHYFEARHLGFRPSLPVFIPFLGAYVAIRSDRINPWQHAKIALAGPLLGGIAAGAVFGVGAANGSSLLQALGYTGFLLNLFNMLPIGFLDGGAIARSFRFLRLGGAPDRAYALAAAYLGLAGLLVLGMWASHVTQHRL
jgi:Zn-dependent protease